MLSRCQQTEGKESLHAVKLIIIIFVRTDLRVEILEMTGDPRRIARLVIIRQKIARAIAQIPGEFFVIFL